MPQHCPKGQVMRRGYTTQRGTRVPATYIEKHGRGGNPPPADQWTSNVGPRNTKMLGAALKKLRMEAHTSLNAKLGMSIYAPFGAVVNQTALNEYNALGEKYAWTITEANRKALSIDISKATERAIAATPVENCSNPASPAALAAYADRLGLQGDKRKEFVRRGLRGNPTKIGDPKEVWGIFVWTETGRYKPGDQGHVATYSYRKVAEVRADKMNAEGYVHIAGQGYPERGYVVRPISRASFEEWQRQGQRGNPPIPRQDPVERKRRRKLKALAETALHRTVAKTRSRRAFADLDATGERWADRWNEFIVAFGPRKEEISRDAEFMRLYNAVLVAQEVVTKRKTIEALLAYAEKHFGHVVKPNPLLITVGANPPKNNNPITQKELEQLRPMVMRWAFIAAGSEIEQGVEITATPEWWHFDALRNAISLMQPTKAKEHIGVMDKWWDIAYTAAKTGQVSGTTKNPPQVQYKAISLAEAKSFPWFEQARKDYVKFHGVEPKNFKIAVVPNGAKKVTRKAVTVLGKAPELHYIADDHAGSNKQGYHWVHKTTKGKEPIMVKHPDTGNVEVLGGAMRVTDWMHK